MTDAIGVLGTGSYLPSRIVSNEEVAGPAGVDAAWIERKTGIRSRHRAAAHEATSDLAAAAAAQALAAADVDACEVSLIVVATSTPDHPQPATASLVQNLLGADLAAAVDVNAVCSGFVYALAMAHGQLAAQRRGGLALVIGADVYSRILDPSDRGTAILFGDGAGAVVLGPVPRGRGLYASQLRGYGRDHDLIGVAAGGARLPASERTVREGGHHFRMKGRAVREFVSAHVPKLVDQLLVEHDVPCDEVRHMVPHQANGVMLAELCDELALPRMTAHINVDRVANTGAASVPIALDEAERAGRLAEGDTVLLAAFGGGMNSALALLER
ncbi:3-oxoacyl-ACP synthase III family protein [Streptomyces sp. NPDC088354]|uniref:3-oxoacyl-ACP synthase III family protein n=1 Tax=Streptomyces sp. NPDC088354 TaxID=3365856 RepID=UPI003805DBC9